MSGTLISVVGALCGTLLGTWLGYALSVRQSDRLFRRAVLREIAFEYRRLANSRKTAGVHGLILAGIYQCQNDREYAHVIELIDDLAPELPLGTDWRPGNRRFAEFFKQLKAQGKDPLDGRAMRELKSTVE